MSRAPMFFVSAATTAASPEGAVAEMVQQIKQQVQAHGVTGECSLDLVLVFVSMHYVHSVRQITEDLRSALQPKALLGCTAEGVIGSDREIEDLPAITLIAGCLPGVGITPFVLQPAATDWSRLLLDTDEFERAVEARDQTRMFILMGDPFSTPMDDVLQAFNTCYPGIPVVGGMASGSLRPNGNTLFLNEHLTHQGAIGVALSGAVELDVVVSQGCRPIWRPFKVVTAHRNMIYSLEGRPPLALIQDLISELSEEDRLLMQNGLFIGRAIKMGQEVLGRGDFLIRGVVGIDQQSGAIAIGDSIMEGEVVQFHLRDALTAQEDLEMMLITQAFRPPPCGGLLFSCNGRGRRLYDHPNGDVSVIRRSIQDAPVAGFFCAGEIGPVGVTNFLHGHTVSLVLFRPIP